MSETKAICLFKKRADGSIARQVVDQDSFSSKDDFNEAYDFYISEGYVESFNEVVNS